MKKTNTYDFSNLPYSLVFANKVCNGNTYKINECLKSQMQIYDTKLNNVQNHYIKNFKKYRNSLCSNISSIYKSGNSQSIKYGNCIISLDKWFLEKIKKIKDSIIFMVLYTTYSKNLQYPHHANNYHTLQNLDQPRR